MIPPTAVTSARFWPLALARARLRRWILRGVLSWAALELTIHITLH